MDGVTIGLKLFLTQIFFVLKQELDFGKYQKEHIPMKFT